MCQEKTNENISITVYHCCGDCKNKLIIPVGMSNDSELICLNNNPEVNHRGGLSKCTEYQEE